MSFILNDIQHAFKKSVLEQECAKLSDSKSQGTVIKDLIVKAFMMIDAKEYSKAVV